MLLTLSMGPIGNLLPHVFGPSQAINLVLDDAPGRLRLSGLGGGAASWPSADDHAVVVRLVDAATFERVAARAHRRLEDARAVIVGFPLMPRHRQTLARFGFTDIRTFPGGGRESVVFLRPEAPLARRSDASALAGRAAMRRLIIVDPCLGGAAGHYQGYARMLTQGALAFGAEVVWGCHASLDAALAPRGVIVRACFARSFFDLSGDEIGAVDLSHELLDGWLALLDEFDAPDTHFLIHSVDSHQLRAVDALSRRGPAPQSTIHVNFQTSPRFMPGRLAGVEAHRAVAALRASTAWERSLFFWAETRRLGLWLSQWLGEDIPALPWLVPADRDHAAPERPPGSMPTLAFLGEGRATKGFLDLPDHADAIASEPHLSSGLRFMIQNWRPFRGDQDRHEQALVRLSAHPFVERVDGVLDPAAYDALLARADMLLLPYDPATYDLQGSGILVEGFANGSIIIARAGMAVEDEAAHGVIFTFRTAAELTEVLTAILADFDALRELAKTKAERFRAHASAPRYIATLDARARGLSLDIVDPARSL